MTSPGNSKATKAVLLSFGLSWGYLILPQGPHDQTNVGHHNKSLYKRDMLDRCCTSYLLPIEVNKGYRLPDVILNRLQEG